MANLPFATIDSHARALGKPSMSQHDRDLVLHLPSAMIARAEAARAAVDMVGDTVSDTPELVVVVQDEQGKHLFEIGALVRVREH
jgi:hypothetical protein